MLDSGWLWLLAITAVALAAAGWLIAARRRTTAPVSSVPGRPPHAEDDGDGLIRPVAPAPAPPEDEESLDVWGFRDTRFFMNDRDVVEIAGNRYELSGCELPLLVPWARKVLKVELTRKAVNPPGYPPAIPDSGAGKELLDGLLGFLSDEQITAEPRVRLRHGHGHTQEEMYAIKYGRLDRVPDLVVYPEDDEQVSALVQLRGGQRRLA